MKKSSLLKTAFAGLLSLSLCTSMYGATGFFGSSSNNMNIVSARSDDGIILPGEILTPGRRYYSNNGKYKLVFQGDGNLVIYGPKGAVWNSHTQNMGATKCVFQTDGNLVIYKNGKALWNSETNGYNYSILNISDYGELVLTVPKTAPCNKVGYEYYVYILHNNLVVWY